MSETENQGQGPRISGNNDDKLSVAHKVWIVEPNLGICVHHRHPGPWPGAVRAVSPFAGEAVFAFGKEIRFPTKPRRLSPAMADYSRLLPILAPTCPTAHPVRIGAALDPRRTRPKNPA